MKPFVRSQDDKIIWDVGHQAYIHKLLTGRRSKMDTIRQQGGLSGTLISLPSSCRSAGHLPIH